MQFNFIDSNAANISPIGMSELLTRYYPPIKVTKSLNFEDRK